MIHVLVAGLGETISARAWRSLSAEEQERAARIAHRGERMLFVAGRHLLQTALAEATGVEKFYTVAQDGNGKPYLVHGPSCLDFSISHSGNAVAVAVSSSGPVGLDIERLSGVDPEAIESAFTAPELLSLSRVPAAERPIACIRAWSEKEAAAKLHGAHRSGDGAREIDLKSWTLGFGPENYQLCLAHTRAHAAEILLRRESA